jgi:Terpene synthase family 2, C-terminal metal binding
MTWQGGSRESKESSEGTVPATVFCPFPARTSPHAAELDRYAIDWATRHGFLPTARHRAAFARARFASLVARAYPDAGHADLCLAVSWLTFTFMLDDHLETVLGRQPESQRDLADRVLRYLRGGPVPALPKPLAGALTDVWTRTVARTRTDAGAVWRGRFAGHVAQYLAANAWEADNRSRGRVPPVAEYLRMRRHSAATSMFFDLAETLAGLEPATDPYAEAAVTLLRQHAANVVAWFNDLVSWPKEAAAGDPHNFVLLAHRELGIPLAEAVRYVVGRHDREVRSFLAAGRDFAGRRADLRRHVASLEHWMRANVDWSRESGRYARDEAD